MTSLDRHLLNKAKERRAKKDEKAKDKHDAGVRKLQQHREMVENERRKRGQIS
jgi:hypothetical protein